MIIKQMGTSTSSKVFALSLGQTLTAIFAIVSGMIASRYLSVTDYATMRQTFLAYEFIAPFLTLGLPVVLYYYLPKPHINKRKIVLETTLILFLLGGLFSLFLTFGGNEYLALQFKNPDLAKTLLWMTPYALYTFPVMVFGSILVVEGKTIQLAIYNALTIIIPTIFVIIAILITRSYVYPTLIRILFPICFIPVVFYMVLKTIPGGIPKPEIKEMVGILKFALPLGLATLFSTISQQLDKVIVSVFSSPENYAYYANGAIEIPLIGIITGSIGTVIMGEMSLAYQNGEKQRAIEIFRNAAIKSASILIPAMFFFLIIAREFIVIMFSETYLESIEVFMVYLLMLPARIVFYGAAFMAMGETKKILYRTAISLVINAILGIILVNMFGFIGAAIASLLTLYFFIIPYNLVAIGKGFNSPTLYIIPFRKIGAITLIAAISSVIPYAIIHFSNNLSNIIVVIVCFISFAIVLVPLLLKFDLFYIPDKLKTYLKLIYK